MTAAAFLLILAAGTLLALGAQFFWKAARRWLLESGPLVAAGLVLLAVWQLVTVRFALLPAVYFPSPARVLQTLVAERADLLHHAWLSFELLFDGYVVGAAAGYTGLTPAVGRIEELNIGKAELVAREVALRIRKLRHRR